VKILITAQNEFSGDNLEVGQQYNVEPYRDGTSRQNKTLHKLIAIYFRSGAYSYPAKTERDLKDQLKLYIGQGVDYYVYVNKNGNKCKSKQYPEDYLVYNGEKLIWQKLISWTKYTKRQRMNLIDGVIKEMITTGVNSKEFCEVLETLEQNSMGRVAG
jgi:hypothetical protein